MTAARERKSEIGKVQEDANILVEEPEKLVHERGKGGMCSGSNEGDYGPERESDGTMKVRLGSAVQGMAPPPTRT